MIGKNTINPCVSDPQGKTERKRTREEILVLREGYEKALVGEGYTSIYATERAAEVYPMPKKIVPREVRYAGSTYRFVNGQFEYEDPAGRWWRSSTFADVAGAKALFDLIDNPTCEVEIDD